MPKEHVVVTESAPKKQTKEGGKKYSFRREILLIFLLPFIIPVGLFFFTRPTKDCPIVKVEGGGRKAIGRYCISLERAETEQARIQGLSGRDSLINKGMVFVFDETGTHCMWMKDMKLSLDMIWVGEDQKVTEIKRNIKPESYPESFCNRLPARYVIEISAGDADNFKINTGQHIPL